MELLKHQCEQHSQGPGDLSGTGRPRSSFMSLPAKYEVGDRAVVLTQFKSKSASKAVQMCSEFKNRRVTAHGCAHSRLVSFFYVELNGSLKQGRTVTRAPS